MKNQTLIPVLLPTDEVSNIIENLYHQIAYSPKAIKCDGTKHLYLCSDALIKEGDYFILHKKVQKCFKVPNEYEIAYDYNKPTYQLESVSFCQKIEFATDQKLIADGVSAIDGNTKAMIDNPNYTYGKYAERFLERNFLEEYCKRYNQKDNQKGVDVEGLAKKNCINVSEMLGFEKGYKLALQSNAEGFSETQVLNMLTGIVNQAYKDRNNLGGLSVFYPYAKKWFNENKPALSTKEQPKGDIIIECEMENTNSNLSTDPIYKIKLNNGQPTLIFK